MVVFQIQPILPKSWAVQNVLTIKAIWGLRIIQKAVYKSSYSTNGLERLGFELDSLGFEE